MREEGTNLFEIMGLCTKREKHFEYFVSKTEEGRTFYEFKFGRDIYSRDIDAEAVPILDIPELERAGVPLFFQNEKGEIKEL